MNRRNSERVARTNKLNSEREARTKEYLSLLLQADEFGSRKDAIRLINKADAIRREMVKESPTPIH